jgi:uncharacterized protein YkwD
MIGAMKHTHRRSFRSRPVVIAFSVAAALAGTGTAFADTPASAPALDPATVAARVLELVNAARDQGRDCGRERFQPVPPLKLSPQLTTAASGHASDMARNAVLAHTGSDGSTTDQRIARTGYAFGVSGENVAAGQKNVESVVAAWLATPGHCATLMGPQYKEMGVAFAIAPPDEKNLSIYWTQVLATRL